jgi:hypothetical protein
MKPPPIPAAAKRRPSIPPPIPQRAKDASRDDGSVNIDVDLTPSFELVAAPPPALTARPIARGTVPPDQWPDDDPTPLPPPYLESDDDWLDAERIVHAAPAEDRTSNIRELFARVPIVKLGIAAILAGGLSAMAVIMLRQSSTPTARPAAAPPVATAQPRATVTPIEVPVEESRAAPVAEVAASQPKPAAKRAGVPAAASAGPRAPRGATPGADPAVGTLMVSSKPPCEIVIDGVATVLTTPQRAIKLRPGKHKVTLLNEDYKIDATFEVLVEPQKATKLIRDLMPK